MLLLIGAHRVFERIALDIGDLGPVVARGPGKTVHRAGADHRVVELPVCSHRRRLRAGVVEEGVACRLLGPASQVFGLVHAIELGLDDAWIVDAFELREPADLAIAAGENERLRLTPAYEIERERGEGEGMRAVRFIVGLLPDPANDVAVAQARGLDLEVEEIELQLRSRRGNIGRSACPLAPVR